MSDKADDDLREPVRAAGGVLWRGVGDALEIALVHRPRYDDWSLPKGKLDAGEGFVEAALREVEEETGHRADLGVALGEIHYHHHGRAKVVRYWAMRALDGRFGAGGEVDELRWATPDAAALLLTYDRDREVLDRFAQTNPDTPVASRHGEGG